MVDLKRFDICLVELDPPVGSEIKKTRPAVVLSPYSMNRSRLKTIIVAPMTSIIRDHFPTRVDINFQNKKGQIALDKIRVIDRVRILKVLGDVDKKIGLQILKILTIMFQ